MKKKSENGKLHISFHNPNTAEETYKELIRLLAQGVIEKVLKHSSKTDK